MDKPCTGCPTLVTPPKRLCPVCLAAHNKASRTITNAKFIATRNLRPGEARAQDDGPIKQAALMTQEEAAAQLAFWEEIEKLQADPNSTEADLEALAERGVAPLSKQAIQLIERRALRKLHVALRDDWAAYEQEKRKPADA